MSKMVKKEVLVENLGKLGDFLDELHLKNIEVVLLLENMVDLIKENMMMDVVRQIIKQENKG